MKFSRGALISMFVVLLLVVDQVIKFSVKLNMTLGESIPVFGDWFQICFVENNGMAFGMELGSKLLLTLFRIVAVILFIYYIYRIKDKEGFHKGYITCISLITAGALGNVIDCIFYGVIFDNPVPPFTATFMPDGGGYGTLFHGRVVDMLYFPLVEWNWPNWLPFVGGEHFIFFQPIFNFADAALSVGVIVLILFYSKFFYDDSLKVTKDSEE